MKDRFIDEDLVTVERSIQSDIFRDKSILVSGGSGFLGSWLCDVLIASGSRVLCLDNLSTGVLENIEHLKKCQQFRFQRADVCTFSSKKKFDFVLHLASRPSPEDYQTHPVDTALANSTGTDKLLTIARKNDARFFYASSSEVYGDPEIFPTPESYEGKVDPLGPRSCYEEGKRFGEALCKAYHSQYGLDVRIGRIFNSYGPRLRSEGQYGRVISRFIRQALAGENVTIFGDGTQTRSFCYVTDTLTGILRLTSLSSKEPVALNLGMDHETTIIDLARQIIALCDSRSRIVFSKMPAGDHIRRLPDITNAHRLLDWNSRVTLDDGLTRTIRGFQLDNSSVRRTAGVTRSPKDIPRPSTKH